MSERTIHALHGRRLTCATPAGAAFLALLFVLSSQPGCDTRVIAPTSQQTAWERWKSFAFHDYIIDQRRTCFCVGAGEVVRITVRSDTIASITRLADDSIVTSPYYRTIDSLFGMIRSGTGDSIVVHYNDAYGYPEYLDINPQLHPVDGGVLYETFRLVPSKVQHEGAASDL